MITQRLKELRKSLNISQYELAYMLKVAQQTVAKWEMGIYVPPMDKIDKLAKIFNVSSDYIRGLTNDTTYLPEKKYRIEVALNLSFGDDCQAYQWKVLSESQDVEIIVESGYSENPLKAWEDAYRCYVNHDMTKEKTKV